jgi:spore coat polysaccharide biosynthesis predicted glycosyltransferase SpsG
VSPTVGIVADAQAGNGLGHISRCSAVALALSCKGIEHRCYAFGSPSTIHRDGIDWSPLAEATRARVEGDAVVFDSYEMDESDQRAIAAGRAIVVMHEGRPVDHAALAVNTTLPPSTDERHLYGLAYAALRPPFWGVTRTSVAPSVRSVLVTVGASDPSALSTRLARIAQRVLPDATVRVVRGSGATFDAPPGVEVIDAPDHLLHAFLSSDIAICSGGQTSLEAAATGTPSLTLSLADNQTPNTRLLQELGVTIAPDPANEEAIAVALEELAANADRRRSMSKEARSVVDGNGALRVAFRISELLP